MMENLSWNRANDSLTLCERISLKHDDRIGCDEASVNIKIKMDRRFRVQFSSRARAVIVN